MYECETWLSYAFVGWARVEGKRNDKREFLSQIMVCTLLILLAKLTLKTENDQNNNKERSGIDHATNHSWRTNSTQ